ncbi:MAG: CdaR family protein [Eubacteriales bacterium]|nr:CdaR family protein [Eubacteriales bacterium]
MKEKLINNLGLKILSIFLAFFVWLVVMNVSNPLTDDSKEVPLEMENGQVLTSAGRAYEISGKSTVTVSYSVRARDAYRIRTADFRAYVDLSELYDVTGSVEVKVDVLNNADLISSVEPKPGVVRVQTEELQSKPFSLQVKTDGTVEDGYAVGRTELSPSQVTVQGPISEVGLISYAGVEIDVDGQSSDVEGTAKPVFYDANRNPLTISDRITVTPAEIQYTAAINKVKNLTLDFEISGTAASGYQYTGLECSVKKVAVTGLRTNLAEVNKITIPSSELSISGASADVVKTVDLRNYLPAGISLADSVDPEVEIRLKIEPLVERTVILNESEIERRNASDDYEYRITPNRLEVVIRGLEEDLDSINGRDLSAYVDLSGIQPGTHAGRLQFESDAVFDIISYSDFQVEATQRASVLVPGTDAGSTESGDNTAEETTDETEDTEAG